MADNKTGLNAQYQSPPFGLAGDYSNSGAAGSPGVTDSAPGVGGGAVIASPVVSAAFDSSQIASNMPTVPVVAGDTSGFSDDLPVHQSPLLPGPPASYMDSGAGEGHAGHFPHPNAAPGRA
jgi:hypothetical protein